MATLAHAYSTGRYVVLAPIRYLAVMDDFGNLIAVY